MGVREDYTAAIAGLPEHLHQSFFYEIAGSGRDWKLYVFVGREQESASLVVQGQDACRSNLVKRSQVIIQSLHKIAQETASESEDKT